MQEVHVGSPFGEEPLEEDRATHSSSLAWEIPLDRGAWRAMVHGVAKSWTRPRDGTTAAVSQDETSSSSERGTEEETRLTPGPFQACPWGLRSTESRSRENSDLG